MSIRSMLACGAVIVPAFGLSPAREAPGAPADIEGVAVVNCKAVNMQAMNALESSLRSAYSAAQSNAAKNGSTGRYPSAARDSRDILKQALGRADKMIADYRKVKSTNPGVTTYAEAHMMSEYARSIIEVLPKAAYWASISKVYYASAEALKTFDYTSRAMEQGLELFVDGRHCYMAGFP